MDNLERLTLKLALGKYQLFTSAFKAKINNKLGFGLKIVRKDDGPFYLLPTYAAHILRNNYNYALVNDL